MSGFAIENRAHSRGARRPKSFASSTDANQQNTVGPPTALPHTASVTATQRSDQIADGGAVVGTALNRLEKSAAAPIVLLHGGSKLVESLLLNCGNHFPFDECDELLLVGFARRRQLVKLAGFKAAADRGGRLIRLQQSDSPGVGNLDALAD